MTEQPKYQFIAIIAGIYTILAFSHLVYNVYITKHTAHLTFMWIFLVITAQCLLVLYGILNNSYGTYLPATILLICLFYILYVKLKNYEDSNIETQLKTKNII